MPERASRTISRDHHSPMVSSERATGHRLADEGFLVNTGTQLILVDAGAGSWWGGGALGRLVGSLRSAGYTPEESILSCSRTSIPITSAA